CDINRINQTYSKQNSHFEPGVSSSSIRTKFLKVDPMDISTPLPQKEKEKLNAAKAAVTEATSGVKTATLGLEVTVGSNPPLYTPIAPAVWILSPRSRDIYPCNQMCEG
ncbi:hypothetical protein BaRGS_00021620, partial [Batillaria attramentaria]